MEKAIKKRILSDKQIIKFSFYGFLKNLKFFEPYLLIFLLANGISLFQIGVLIAVREIIVHIFEIPSGLIADYIGCKTELYLCFTFYILSFIFFYFSMSFWIAMIAMILFGFGEAFRTGTHKAMIYAYLEKKEWSAYKSFVYGKTRSSSLVGSAISSILAILIVLQLKNPGSIFLLSTIPYVLDFLLIASYPDYLNQAEIKKEVSIAEMVRTIGKDIKQNKNLQRIIVAEGLFEAIIKTIIDYIQPMLELIIIGAGTILIMNTTPENNLKIILGIVYFILNLFGAFASRNVYRLKKNKKANFLLNVFYLLLGIELLILAIGSTQYLVVFAGFLLLYIIQNARKPIYMDEIGTLMNKSQRATILSIASQLRSFLLIILAPLVGWIADTWGIPIVMYVLAVILFASFPFIYIKNIKKV